MYHVQKYHQIDNKGVLFLSTWENHRRSAMPGLHPLAVRYATQYDFDKFCFDNPNERLQFDWNAEVYRAFESDTPGVYAPTSNNAKP